MIAMAEPRLGVNAATGRLAAQVGGKPSSIMVHLAGPESAKATTSSPKSTQGEGEPDRQPKSESPRGHARTRRIRSLVIGVTHIAHFFGLLEIPTKVNPEI